TFPSAPLRALAAALAAYDPPERARRCYTRQAETAAWLRGELRRRGVEPLAAEVDSGPSVITFTPPDGLTSEAFVARCRGWGLLVFLAFQAAFTAALDRWHPELYDAEYGRRLTALCTRRAEAPERPLFLVVGSSRTALAFRPEIVPPLASPSGVAALPFNFSH